MKFFNVQIKPFSGTSTDYVTKDAVERANARLMGTPGVKVLFVEDVFANYNLTRPSHEEIAKAAAQAMSQLPSQ